MLHASYRSLFAKVTLILSLLAPLEALAEVSDKVPSIPYVWSVAAISSVVYFLASRYRRSLALVLGTLPAVWFASLLLEIHSSDVGMYLYREQGISYYAHAYAALILLVSSAIFGWVKK